MSGAGQQEAMSIMDAKMEEMDAQMDEVSIQIDTPFSGLGASECCGRTGKREGGSGGSKTPGQAGWFREGEPF